jgi:hypothetical protein
MGRVDREGGEQRKDVAQEMILDPGELAFADVLAVYENDSVIAC